MSAGRIVATHSFRGGTGKSNLTGNLAAILAARGQRVAIIDSDIQSPGIHVLFGIEPEQLTPTLNDYLWGRCAVEAAAHDVSGRVLGADGRPALPAGAAVHLVPASVRAGEIARIIKEGYDVEVLSEGFRALIERLGLDCLFIDTHPGLNEETLLSIAVADVLLLILRPDWQDYQGTAVTLEVARRLEVPELLLVVNKALPSFDLLILRDQIARTYQTPVASVIPFSEDLIRLGSGGLFTFLFPEHAVTRAITAIADRIGG